MTDPQAGRRWIPGSPDADRHWLAAAIDLSRRCPPSDSAFSVGAILVAASGEVIATGYSREVDPKDHAEEVALRRAAEPTPAEPARADARVRDPVHAAGADLSQATLYSSLEPCLRRRSRPTSCAALIAAAGLRRVVIAWREPPLFVPGGGTAWLAARGITVIEMSELTAAAKAVNQHLLSR